MLFFAEALARADGMKVLIKQGDVYAEPAGVLVCSANVFLNLSGGVGGEILRWHGRAMQDALHRYLRERGRNFVQRGEVVVTERFGTGFKHVLHAVAVDAWYESSAGVVNVVLREAFRRAVELGAKSAAVVPLATGYGRLGIEEFAKVFGEAVKGAHGQFEKIVVVLHKVDEAEAVSAVLK